MRFFGLEALMTSASFLGAAKADSFIGDGHKIIRCGVVGFLRLAEALWSGDFKKSSPITTPESLELLSELRRNAGGSLIAPSSSWDPFTFSTLLMYSVGGSVWNLLVISDVKKEVLMVAPFVTASDLSNCSFSTGSCKNRFALAACASGSRTGPLPFVIFSCFDCVTSDGGSFSIDGASSNESQLSSECDPWPFWTRMRPLAGSRAKYSLIFLVDRVAGRKGFEWRPSLTFPAPFSIKTPSILVSFRLGLLNDWSSSETNIERLGGIFFGDAVEATFCAARGLRPTNKKKRFFFPV